MLSQSDRQSLNSTRSDEKLAYAVWPIDFDTSSGVVGVDAVENSASVVVLVDQGL